MPELAQEKAELTGRTFGRYRVLGKLGTGGMGVVYEAEDNVLQRRVAIKSLPILHEATAADRARLIGEARSAARISHPHVVTVYDVESADEFDFLVMELLPLGSLGQWLSQRGPLPWRLATRLVAQACAGLTAAHAAGIVHRDIKPSNLMLVGGASAPPPADRWPDEDSLAVKIADFGISRLTYPTVSGPVAASGTVHFMSPEQCEGEAEPRSDLYSLGATYYALVAGRPPFIAEHPLQVMFQHCASPVPDPRDLRPDLPAECGAIIRRALAKEPGDRYADAAQMQADLLRLLAGQPLASAGRSTGATTGRLAATSGLPRRFALRRAILAALLVMLALLGALVSLPFWPREPAGTSVPAAVAGSSLPAPSLSSSPAAISLAWRPGTRRLRGELQMAVVSRNGRYLACALEEGTALVWDLEADEQTRWLERPDFEPWVHALAFTPDSDWVVAGFGNLVQIHHVPSGRYERLQELQGQARGVAVSSCGRYLAVAEDRGEAEHGRVWLHRFGQSEEAWKIDHSHEFEHAYRLPVRFVTFSPDASCLAAYDSGGNLNVYDVASAANMRLLNMPEPHRAGSYGRCAEFSPNSQVLAAAGDRRVVLWDTGTWQQRVLGEGHQSAITHLAWSRNGRWLITAANDGLLFWDAASGQKLRDQPLDAGREIRTLLFLGGDEWLLSGTSDKRLLLWNWRQALEIADRPQELRR